MIKDEEFEIIADKYFAKIRRLGLELAELGEAYIPSKVEEINEALERIKEIRSIQRKQRGEVE